jgi:hypothetical protein
MTDSSHERGSDGGMERMTFRIPERQRDALETAADERGYPNPSEALRAAVREWVSDGTAYDDGRDDDLRGPDGRQYPRPDGGRVPPGPSATNRDPRGRQERGRGPPRERGGVGDQRRDRCAECRGDLLPCWECLGGEE